MLTGRHCSKAATLVFHSTHEKSSTFINPTKKSCFFIIPMEVINPYHPPKKKIVTAWKTGAPKHIKTHHLSAVSAVPEEFLLSRVPGRDPAHDLDAMDPVADYGDPGIGFEAGLVPWWGRPWSKVALLVFWKMS